MRVLFVAQSIVIDSAIQRYLHKCILDIDYKYKFTYVIDPL